MSASGGAFALPEPNVLCSNRSELLYFKCFIFIYINNILSKNVEMQPKPNLWIRHCTYAHLKQ